MASTAITIASFSSSITEADMSQKHHQRTRAQILAKRNKPIEAWAGWKSIFRPAVIPSKPNADVRKASRSKYTPHTGAKQRAKLKNEFKLTA
jgi:hypothetical protein